MVCFDKNHYWASELASPTLASCSWNSSVCMFVLYVFESNKTNALCHTHMNDDVLQLPTLPIHVHVYRHYVDMHACMLASLALNVQHSPSNFVWSPPPSFLDGTSPDTHSTGLSTTRGLCQMARVALLSFCEQFGRPRAKEVRRVLSSPPPPGQTPHHVLSALHRVCLPLQWLWET